jgi:N-acetylneuraminic acid mutarotase
LAQLNSKVSSVIVRDITYQSGIVYWGCSIESEGGFFLNSEDKVVNFYTPIKSKLHSYAITELKPNTSYTFTVFCGNNFDNLTLWNFISNFRTLSRDPTLSEIYQRGIWIIGGMNSQDKLISDVDIYDPIDNKWYLKVTSMPHSRIHAGVISFDSKIYVFGGLIENTSNQLAATNLVEVFDIETTTWKTLNNMPTSLQGFSYGISDSSIYLLGGATTSNMLTSTLLNTIYKFNPQSGDLGSWSTLISSAAISQKVDTVGCTFTGVLYFGLGRSASTGLAQSTHDAYVISSNSTSSITESAFNLGRHGASSICYTPKATDPFPSDSKAILYIGGSTAQDTSQPVAAIGSSNIYEYYLPNDSSVNPNTISTGLSLPINVYMAAGEVSYLKRNAYLFGGLISRNSINDTVYSLDLSNPLGNSWATLSEKMPTPRYGHKAIILNRN